MTHDALLMVEYGCEPGVLLIADSEAGMERARSAAARAGCRVIDALALEGLDERLDRQVAADALLVDVGRDHGPALERLLDRVQIEARTGGRGAVVSAPAELIDLVAARAWGAEHLCDSDAAEMAGAIARAAERAEPVLHDIKGQGGPRLQQLSEEVGRIASVLASLSEEEVLPQPGEAGGEPASAASIRTMIRARRLRDQYFPADLFADPAWDMLLDLMAARLDGKRVAVSSLCIAASVPATTALRWIKALTDQGLFLRVADPQDGRRVFIELSDGAAQQLAAYLKALRRIAPGVV